MKLTEIDKFIKDNNLLTGVENRAGIYAITINDSIAYIGKSKHMRNRCSQHIYYTQNAVFNKEKKYELLYAAQIGGLRVDCSPIIYCEENELSEYEDKYIEEIMPPLNILTPVGKQDISDLTIFDLKERLKYVLVRPKARIKISKDTE